MKQTSPQLLSCPNQLTEAQIQQFQESGYLAFSDVLSAEETERSRDALCRISHELSQDSSSHFKPFGSSKGNQSGAVFNRADSRSMMQLEPGYDPVGKSPEEIDAKVRKFMWFCDEDPVFADMVAPGGRMHAVVESILGAAPILFQEMALVKPALVGTEKPWHQDNAYFAVEPLSEILGVWLALDDATPENGCMHVIPGGHLDGGFRHHHRSDCEIAPELLETERSEAVPIPAGGAMFFYGMLPHRTPPNRSPHRRRALQFHFRSAGTRIIDEAAYDRLFVDRLGVPASCRAASRLGF